MNSRFRFPRRVRIHGGECGAVARALHHKAQKESLMEHESLFLSQAESEKFFDSTLNERKQMSTKTSIKRIALIVASALGFGVLSLAPASAAAYVVTSPTVGTPSICPAIGVASTTTIGFSVGALASGDTLSGATVSLTVPATSAVTLADRNGAGGGATNAFSTASMTTSLGAVVDNVTGAITATTGAAIAAGAVTAGTITIEPDITGTYTVKVTTSDGIVASKSFQAGVDYPFTVTGAVLAGSLVGANCSAVSASQIAGAGNYISIVSDRNTSNTAAGTDYDYVTVSGSTIVNQVGFSTTSPLNNTTTRVKNPGTTDGSVDFGDQIWVSAETAGTITVKYIRRSFTAGVATDTTRQTITITVGSADLDPAASKALLGSGTTAATTTDATLTPFAYTATGVLANISLSFKNLTGTAFTGASPVLSASVSGPGLISKAANAAACAVGTSKVAAITPGVDGALCISSDGTAGTATITILAGSTVWSTKTVVFAGPAAAFKVDSTTSSALGASKLAANLGVGDQNWWDLSTVDAAGNAVSATPSLTVTIADTTILSNVSDVPGVVKVQGVKAGSTTFTVTSGTVTLGPVTVNVSEKAASSATFTLDKSSYQVGEAFTLTIDAKDSGARPLADATYASMATLAPSVLVYGSGGAVLGGALSPTFIGGKTTVTGFMPATTGTVTFKLTLGTTGVATEAQGAVLTASADVSSAALTAAEAATDAAAEAIDAANAATDAANLAAEAADAATVAAEEARDAADAATAAIEELATQVASLIASLKAQITTLANTVAKIAKKVRA